MQPGKRQTSFVSCDIMRISKKTWMTEINDEDIRIDTYRSSGMADSISIRPLLPSILHISWNRGTVSE